LQSSRIKRTLKAQGPEPRRRIEHSSRPEAARAIEEFRSERGWDLQQLADVTDMPRPLVRQMELGTCRLVPEAAQRLADAFEVEVEVIRELAARDGYWFDPDERQD
jgi:transcriptional regulator with XRE-family HTH domain